MSSHSSPFTIECKKDVFDDSSGFRIRQRPRTTAAAGFPPASGTRTELPAREATGEPQQST